MMKNQRNLRIYRYWAPLYDAWVPLLSGRARQHAIGMLNPQPGERLLIPGIGTGLDLPHLPHGISITGVDYSPDMLARIQAKNRTANLAQMDAQQLGFPARSFDAVLFNLILSVVPNGTIAFREGWRALRPGGRAVIFDKFLPEHAPLTPVRRLLGHVITSLGTDPNRRLTDIIGDTPGVSVARDEPSLLRGQYRILLLKKEEEAS
jgi:ubiquinone/menaquinone biosynthesis C-methylase UbiE